LTVREPPLKRGLEKFFLLPTYLLAIWQDLPSLLSCYQLLYSGSGWDSVGERLWWARAGISCCPFTEWSLEVGV